MGHPAAVFVAISGGGLVAYSDSSSDIGSYNVKSSQMESKKKVVVLGTGWAGTSFLKNLGSSQYDVHVVSPRNYFAFTPLLPSVTCGLVEPRSIVEPIRKIIRKEIEDAQEIRRSVIECFDKASLPNLRDEQRKMKLHFGIVGGGPTGVEFAAELHDFVTEDLIKLYPLLQDLVKITLVEAGDHILSMFDRRITAFAEEKFKRDGIDAKTGYQVVSVSDKAHYEDWDTESLLLTLFPLIMAFTVVINLEQKDKEDIAAIFKVTDKDKSGTLTAKELQDVINDICERYPQVKLYLKNKQMRDVVDLLYTSKGNDKLESKELDIEEFKKALSDVDF
ncbi:external alternative NAD(P)H-ubiquinone oxidoreductase B2, mitochondrial-like [Tasmannia lanceolata]|uniref:external alternative NAD(P)H-ubiquinone oxidoreductase B2, mitochondrial-like n=1 Tax=Tasmannia lanceolata TaxID=3420 RepID=UPI004062CFCB